jgi:hypothetical protein
MGEVFRFAEQPAFKLNLLREGKLTQMLRRKIRVYHSLQSNIRPTEKEKQAADQDGWPATAVKPHCEAQDPHSTEPERRADKPAPGSTNLTEEIRDRKDDEQGSTETGGWRLEARGLGLGAGGLKSAAHGSFTHSSFPVPSCS